MKKLFALFCIGLLTLSSLFYVVKSKVTTKPQVLVTIAPHKYFVERLTDHQVEVAGLVPEVADPHGFEPTAKDLLNLFEAKVWFLSGEPFEEQFATILKKNNPSIEVVDLKGDYDNLHVSCCHHAHVEDLHFWMSPKIARLQCQDVARKLVEHFPQYKEIIEKNAVELDRDFLDLDAKLTKQLSDCHGSSFLVSHPAFGYFARDYHLHQLALETETQDPSPKEFASLLGKIKEEKIKTLYVQKQYNYKASKQLADSHNLEMFEVNPYAYNYFENLTAFGSHLGGQS